MSWPLEKTGFAGEAGYVPRTGAHHYHSLWGLVWLTAVLFWIVPLRSSLWLDETVTYWTACKGIAPAIFRSQFIPGQHLVYSLIAAAAMRVGGTSEVALRLPSVLAIGLSAWLLFQLARALFDHETGILAVLVFSSFHIVAIHGAVNARPYGIGLLLIIAGALELVRWMRSGRLRNMLAFVFLTAAIPYLHYLFAVIYLVFFVYSVYVTWSGEGKVSKIKLATAWSLVLLLMLPLLWNALEARRVSAANSFASPPDTAQLLFWLLTPVLGASLFLGLLLSIVFCRRCGASFTEMPRSVWVLLLSWFAIPIAVLYLIARLTPFETFVPRYFLTGVPALSLLVGWMIRGLEPSRARVIVATTIALTSGFSFRGNFSHSIHQEDWKSAAALVRAANISDSTPLLIHPGLIESARVQWNLNIDQDSPLLSPISKYPFPGRIVLVPYAINGEATNYMEEVYARILKSADSVVLVSRNGENIEPWLRGWFLGRGFMASEMGHPPGITVLLFRREGSR